MELPEFDQKLTLQWIAALESGKIEQATSCLITSDKKMCCLGVLGSLMGGKQIEEHRTSYMEIDGVKHYGMLPTEMLERVGLTSHISKDTTDKSREGYLRAKDYVEMNDAGLSFSAIAGQLRKDLAKKGRI